MQKCESCSECDTQVGYSSFVVSYFEKLFKDTQKDTVTLLLMLKLLMLCAVCFSN